MGFTAESFKTFAQPLIDECKSIEFAMFLAEICWNLAIVPPEGREDVLKKMREIISMEDLEFEEIQRDVINPMIQRHKEMFPEMHDGKAKSINNKESSPSVFINSFNKNISKLKTGRNSMCPCGSNKKYKKCCGIA